MPSPTVEVDLQRESIARLAGLPIGTGAMSVRGRGQVRRAALASANATINDSTAYTIKVLRQ